MLPLHALSLNAPNVSAAGDEESSDEDVHIPRNDPRWAMRAASTQIGVLAKQHTEYSFEGCSSMLVAITHNEVDPFVTVNISQVVLLEDGSADRQLIAELESHARIEHGTERVVELRLSTEEEWKKRDRKCKHTMRKGMFAAAAALERFFPRLERVRYEDVATTGYGPDYGPGRQRHDHLKAILSAIVHPAGVQRKTIRDHINPMYYRKEYYKNTLGVTFDDEEADAQVQEDSINVLIDEFAALRQIRKLTLEQVENVLTSNTSRWRTETEADGQCFEFHCDLLQVGRQYEEDNVPRNKWVLRRPTSAARAVAKKQRVE